MAGKPRRERSMQTLVKELQDSSTMMYAITRNKFTPQAIVQPFFGSAPSSQALDPIQRLATQGDTMIGPIAYYFKTAGIISGGVLDIGKNTSIYSSYVIVDGEGSVDDDLVTISGAAFRGQMLILEAITGQVITIKHGTGNIRVPGGIDYKLKGPDMVVLMYDDTQTDPWGVQTNTQTILPFTSPVKDHGTIGSVTESIDLSPKEAHIHKMTLNGNITLAFNNPPASGRNVMFELEIKQDATGGRTVTFPASVRTTPTVDTAANAVTVLVCQTSDGGTNYDVFNTVTSGGTGANTALSNLAAVAINTSLLPAGDGTIDLGDATHYWDDLFAEQIRLKSTGGTVVTNIPMITSSATGDLILNVNTSDLFDFQVLGVSKWTISATTLSGANIVLSNTLSINDSTTITTSAGQLSRSGSVVYIGGAFAPGNTGTQDLGGSGQIWNDIWLEQARFHQGTVVSNKPIITADATDGMIINVATGQQFDLRVNNVSKWTISASSLTGANIILSNLLTLNDNTADPGVNGEFARNATHVKVFSGGAVRNLSDIGLTSGGANVNLSNLGVTSINADLLPNGDGTLDLGSGSLYWDDIFVEQTRYKSTGGTVVTNIPMITSSATGDLILNVNTGDVFDFQVLGVSKWQITATQLTGANIILSNVLTLNDNAADPSSNGQIARNSVDVKIYSGGAIRNMTDPNFNTLVVESTASFNGNVVLGNATTDTIFYTGRVSDDGILPLNNEASSLGSSSRVWLNAYIQYHQFSSSTSFYIKRNTSTEDMEMSVPTTSDVYKLRFGGTLAYNINFTSLDLLASDIINVGNFSGNGTVTYDVPSTFSHIFSVNASSVITIGANSITLADAKNFIFNSTTGTKFGTSTTQKIGFWNKTPVGQPSAYTVTNPTTDRALNVTGDTLAQVAAVLGTLIADLQSIGLIG